MRVQVKLYSILRLSIPDYEPERGMDVELAPESRLVELFEQLQIEMRKLSMVRLNGNLSKDYCYILKENDLVELFPLFNEGFN